MRRIMTRFAATALLLVALSSPLLAAASDLRVLPQGRYTCATPGVATGPATILVPESGFSIVRGSSYENAGGRGTYLLASDILTFTRGPLKDVRLRKTREGLWQQIARDGEPGRLKCSRTGPAPA